MNPTHALILAVIIAACLIGVGTRFSNSWPWYACAAIILAGCVYAYFKQEHWLVSWTSW